MKKPKLLLFDLETLPLITTTWGIYRPFITHHNILTDFTICAAAYKELGSKWCTGLTVNASSVRDDKALCRTLRDQLANADLVIGHNIDRFDIPMLNVRLIVHGLKPLPTLNTVDTKKLAFRRFRFSCAKLDYLGKLLGVGRKVSVDGSLWHKVMNGDAAALQRMRRYNIGDVRLNEDLYLKMRAFDDRHPNGNVLTGSRSCPVCAGGLLESAGWRATRTRRYQRYRCTACGHYARDTRSVGSARLVSA